MAKKTSEERKDSKNQEPLKARKYISQADIPSLPLSKALEIPRAIIEHYASKPATPLQVAKALKVLPTSSGFRMACGAALAYGLTVGGALAESISVQQLAKRILKPTSENDDKTALIEAFLKPKLINAFLTKYNGSPIPRVDIANNVLEDMGVPSEKCTSVLNLIITEGEKLGVIIELKGKKYVELSNKTTSNENNIREIPPERIDEDFLNGNDDTNNSNSENGSSISYVQLQEEKNNTERLKKVFITHGKNTKFIEPIKKLLNFGELQPVVSVEKTSISQPVPDKVMNDMRGCGAAIIHVEDEKKLIDANADEHVIINPNVLIEIGAAMALYGRRFILLVKDGVKLPSNLQGLFEVRYSGDELDGNATIKLLEAINDIKNQKLPEN